MPNQTARTVSMRLFLSYVVGSLTAIFYVPYLVPSHPTASDSYLFGYNNRAGIVLLLVLAAIGTVWTRGLKLQFRPSGVSQPVPRKTLCISLLAVLVGCVGMYALAGHFGGFGESSYEIDRLWLLAQGRTPYVDFEWPFGAALLYGPLLLSRMLSIGIVPSYYLFWIVNCLVGTLLLFAVINGIDYPTQYKHTIYLLVYCSWFPSILCMGTHYALVRYTCPLYFVLVAQKYIKGRRTGSRLYGAFLAVAFAVVLLSFSPETAIAYAFACACMFLLSEPNWKDRSLAIFAGMILSLGIVFLIALKLHIFDTVKASGGGADSFPIFFSPHILLFFAAIFTCACYLFHRFHERYIDDNTFGLIAYSVPMLAAALGRCDPGHVLLNGLGVFVASMLYISSHRTPWRWYRGLFFAIFIVFSSIAGLWLYVPSLKRCVLDIVSEGGNHSRFNRVLIFIAREGIAGFAKPAKRAKWERELDDARHAGIPATAELSIVFPAWHGTYLAPVGYKPNGFGDYLSNRVDYGRFEGFENANTVDAIHQKLGEIMNHPEKALLLPDRFESNCKIDVPTERRAISYLFAFPYFGKAVHTDSLRQPVCDYILAKYKLEEPPTAQTFGYGLWIAESLGR